MKIAEAEIEELKQSLRYIEIQLARSREENDNLKAKVADQNAEIERGQETLAKQVRFSQQQGRQIEEGSVHPIDAPIHMQADEGVEAGIAQQARQRADIRDGDPQGRGAARRRDLGSIPEQKPELQIERRDSVSLLLRP